MAVRNILFVMCDQLRADYLGCYGHRTIRTPNIDELASRSLRFTRAYVQAATCGSSRMSFYTGRYVMSHGATWNEVPLNIGLQGFGDHLRAQGLRVAVVGKTHMRPDWDGMGRLGVAKESSLARLAAECGFEPYLRDDGLHPDEIVDEAYPYNAHLRALGYDAPNPWHAFANSADGIDGETLSGWFLRNASRPARVAEAHSETAYATDKAMAFIAEQGDRPWCLHLSYIKPHWPYIVSAPFHAMYGPDDVQPPIREARERVDPTPVYGAYMKHRESVAFARDEVRRAVVPAYMGLVSQIDHHLGRLLAVLANAGRMTDTMIVFTSDHGDFLGDHWLGEKDLLYEPAVRVPLIIYDPDRAANAVGSAVSDALVEAIDLAPTFVDAIGAPQPSHLYEGHSLLPLLRGVGSLPGRDAVFAELDYAFREARQDLGVAADRARGFMVRTGRWKFVHYDGFSSQLFDLQDDPLEFVDLGRDPSVAAVRSEMKDRLFEWSLRRKVRTTVPSDRVEAMMGIADRLGMPIGVW